MTRKLASSHSEFVHHCYTLQATTPILISSLFLRKLNFFTSWTRPCGLDLYLVLYISSKKFILGPRICTHKCYELNSFQPGKAIPSWYHNIWNTKNLQYNRPKIRKRICPECHKSQLVRIMPTKKIRTSTGQMKYSCPEMWWSYPTMRALNLVKSTLLFKLTLMRMEIWIWATNWNVGFWHNFKPQTTHEIPFLSVLNSTLRIFFHLLLYNVCRMILFYSL